MLDFLFLPDKVPSSVVVVLPVDQESCLLGLEPGDDVAPALVVVHTDGDCDVLVFVRLETNNAGRAATTHGDGAGGVVLSPGATVGEVPDGLLDDVEKPASRVGLEDTESDVVRHSDG